MNISFSPTRKQYRVNGSTESPFARPQHRLHNLFTPVLDLVTSPVRSKKEKIKLDNKLLLSATISKELGLSTPTLNSVQSRVKKRLGAGGRALFSSSASSPRPRKQDPENEPGCSRRKVHFERDEVTGDIVEHMHEPEIVLEQEDLDRAWLSRKDLRNCRYRAQETCHFYSLSRPDYQDAMLRLLVKSGAQPTEDFLQAEMEKHRDDFFDDEDDEDVNLIVNSEARGLEKRILNAMELPFHRHKRSIGIALDTQRRVLGLAQGNSFTNDKRARLIASQYSACTKYAATWARLVAVADAKVVELHSNQFVI